MRISVKETEVMMHRNLEGKMLLNFPKRMEIVVVNTFFQNRKERRVTYKSRGSSTQVDYILCG